MNRGYLIPPPLPPGVRNEIAAIMDKNELISDIETLKTSITAVAVIAFVYIVAKFAAVLK